MTVALLDACVLYRAALRDLFLWLAVEGVFTPRWTDEIHDEWIGNVLNNRPDLSPLKLNRTRHLMDRIDPLCLVTGHEPLIPSLSLPDANDRHVLAAAIHASASTIVTYNIADFPDLTLNPFGIKPLHPDEFLIGLMQSSPAEFIIAAARQRRSLSKPAKSPQEYVQTLRSLDLNSLADLLTSKLAEI